ncbi:MAG: hypothetical protein KDD53_12440, partial [Bdellovibrionales bacterium]|nr:hypothetical protein [Bdellovibrionales bacterium]
TLNFRQKLAACSELVEYLPLFQLQLIKRLILIGRYRDFVQAQLEILASTCDSIFVKSTALSLLHALNPENDQQKCELDRFLDENILTTAHRDYIIKLSKEFGLSLDKIWPENTASPRTSPPIQQNTTRSKLVIPEVKGADFNSPEYLRVKAMLEALKISSGKYPLQEKLKADNYLATQPDVMEIARQHAYFTRPIGQTHKKLWTALEQFGRNDKISAFKTLTKSLENEQYDARWFWYMALAAVWGRQEQAAISTLELILEATPDFAQAHALLKILNQPGIKLPVEFRLDYPKVFIEKDLLVLNRSGFKWCLNLLLELGVCAYPRSFSETFASISNGEFCVKPELAERLAPWIRSFQSGGKYTFNENIGV